MMTPFQTSPESASLISVGRATNSKCFVFFKERRGLSLGEMRVREGRETDDEVDSSSASLWPRANKAAERWRVSITPEATPVPGGVLVPEKLKEEPEPRVDGESIDLQWSWAE
jgi:hypothetical protein